MDLCETCDLYTFDRFLIEGSIGHGVIQDLITSSEYCVLCRLILGTVRRRITETTHSAEETDEHIDFLKTSQVSLIYPAVQNATVRSDRIRIDVREPTLMIDGWLVLGDSDTSLRIFREPGKHVLQRLGTASNQMAPGIPQIMDTSIPAGQRIEPTAASPDLHEHITMWLNECNETHEKCREGSRADGEDSRKIPARLLSIGAPDDNEEPRLLETDGSCGPYIALSHSWGQTRHIVTTTENLERHKVSIPYEDLPKTFQDAVALAQNLGLCYIWIDSLCIIQDDIQDWKNEAAKMADVYRNAYCTVAATGSHGDQEGIFVERREQDVFRMRYEAAEIDLMVTYVDDDISTLKELLFDSPLSSRAWTLQEKLLSPRMIQFTRSRAIWECRTRFETEDLLVLGPDDFGGILTSTIFSFSTNRSKWLECLEAVGRASEFSEDAVGEQGMALSNFNRLWYNLLSDYTRRGVTKETDKLIALSGIVQEVEEKAGIRYCAGHWIDILPAGLCWTYGDEPTIRAFPYRAPTWSWASVNGGITHITYEQRMEGEPRTNVDIIDCQVTVGDDGQISAGWLALAGCIKAAGLVPSHPSGGWRTCYVGDYIDESASDDRNLGKVWLDDIGWWEAAFAPSNTDSSEDDQVSRSYYLLNVNSWKWQSNNDQPTQHSYYEVLVLESTGIIGEYVRLGAGYIKVDSWFDDVSKQNISIV